MNKKTLFVVAFIALVVLSACSSAGSSKTVPTPSEPWTNLDEETLGVHVSYPEAWSYEVDPEGGLYISNDETNFGSPMIVDGVAVIISAFDSADFSNLTDPTEIVGVYYKNLQSLSADLQPVGEVETLKIQGNPAAIAHYQGIAFDQNGEFTVTAIVQESRIISALTVDTTEGGSQSQRLRQVVESLDFLK